MTSTPMMDAQRWQRLRALLDRALDMDDAEQKAMIAALPAADAELGEDLQRLLAQHASNQQQRSLDPVELGVPLLLDTRHAADASETARVGQYIGAFKLLRLIGTGGMGAVYLAERTVENFVHRVALKVVRGESVSAAARERFERERQILANLVHPNIGTLFEGGQTADGQPYYTMEYVDGIAITAYCRDRQLSVEQRVRLLIDVAAALSHAHQNLVVHRDIKPSNILVSADGRAKLLDFGIAKLVGNSDAAATQGAFGPMTPEYAAPEQFHNAAVTVATDVYQFGVLCFRVLTGSLPYRADPGDSLAWARAVTTAEPTLLARALDADSVSQAWKDPAKVTRVKRQLRGDLDAIVRKALAKAPQDRYRSMDAMSADFDAFLDGRPVAARRAGAWYFMRRFVARKPWAVAAASSAVIALVLFAVVALHQARLAHAEADRANAVANFLTELFQVSDPGVNRGEHLNANEILDRGASRLDHDMAAQPEQRARLQTVIGEVFSSLGDYPRARPLLVGAVESLRGVGSPLDLGHSLRLLAWVDYRQGDTTAATRLLDEATPLVQGDSQRAYSEQASLYSNRALAKQALGDFPAAHKEFEAALAAAEHAGDQGRMKAASVENNLGLLLRDLGDLPGAKVMLQRALADYRREYGDNHWRSISAAENLGLVLTDLGDYPGALALIKPAVEQYLNQFGPDNADYATSANMLGSVYRRSGDAAQALHYYAIAEKSFRTSLGDHHAYLAWPIINQGRVLLAQGDANAALDKFDQALALRRGALAPQHPELADSLVERSGALLTLHRYDEALHDTEEALTIRRAKLAPDHRFIVETLWQLGLVHYAKGETALASVAWNEALERAPRVYPADSTDLAELRRNIAAPDSVLKQIEIRSERPSSKVAPRSGAS